MKKLTRILSIDGGGIRGIIPGQILVSLEKKLQIIDNNPNGKLSDYFDLVAGTSTGGILACIYLLPDKNNNPMFSAQDAVNLYLQKGNKIFNRTLWQKIKNFGNILDEKYNRKELEKSLDEYMKNTKLSELLKPTLITAYDVKNRKGHFFKSHKAKNHSSYNFTVKDVARSTSAAPTYFELAEIESMNGTKYPLIDGGVFVNNPSLCAYAEARNVIFDEYRIKPTANDMVILSLGTGNKDESYNYDDVKGWGVVQWLSPLISIMMDGVSQTVDYQLRKIFESINKQNQYVRISPKLVHSDEKMDNATKENLLALKLDGELNAKEYDNILTDFAKILINNK